MSKLFIAILLSCLAWTGLNVESCCYSMMEGNFRYTLLGTEDTSFYGCLNNCVYERFDKPGSKFCFAPGNENPRCLAPTPPITTPPSAPISASPSPAEECDLGYTNVCLLDGTGGCRDGMFKYCPREEDGIQHTSQSQKCNCLNAYLVSQAVSSGVNPLGCGKGCVCLREDPSQCKKIR